jgi:hypothetical protein
MRAVIHVDSLPVHHVHMGANARGCGKKRMQEEMVQFIMHRKLCMSSLEEEMACEQSVRRYQNGAVMDGMQEECDISGV